MFFLSATAYPNNGTVMSNTSLTKLHLFQNRRCSICAYILTPKNPLFNINLLQNGVVAVSRKCWEILAKNVHFVIEQCQTSQLRRIRVSLVSKGAGTDKSHRLSGQMTVHPGNATTSDEFKQK